MSWLVATFGTDSGIADRLHARPASEATSHSKTPLFEARIGDVRVSAGGSLRTCHFGWLSPEREGAWVVLGTGVGVPKHTPGATKRILDRNDWSIAVAHPGSIQKDIEGQYVVLIAERDNLYCLADPVGLRDLFVSSNDRTTFVTSRLDWLTSVSPSPTINTNAFGGRWHFFYQLSYDAIIDGVRRLGPGGAAQLTDRTSRFTRFEWQDSKAEDQLEEVMTELALAPARSGLPIDLALSGGVDSRLLFGIYAASDLGRWSTHTFGSPETTDAVIARSLASSYGIPHKQYYHPFDLHAVERTLIEFA
ncbi:MAG TPA: asparagine synthase-related protein, partial [Candidatus Kapabacteria bacterium]|nr:asparagine synthase-related protein [Candidatus Kapabacteria bacterium]